MVKGPYISYQPHRTQCLTELSAFEKAVLGLQEVGHVFVVRDQQPVTGVLHHVQIFTADVQTDSIASLGDAEVDLLVQVAHVGVVHHEAHHRVGHVARGLLEASVDGLRKIVE